MAIIDAGDHSLTLAKKLGAYALKAAVARLVAVNHANHYSLEGTGATALDLSRFGDIGLPDSISKGVEYTGEAAFSSTAVTLTPTRKTKAGTIDKDVYLRRVPGYTLADVKAAIDALDDVATGIEDDDQSMLLIDRAFGIETKQLVGSIKEGWEYDLVNLYASISGSVGTTTANMTITNFEDALATIEGASTLPHDDIIFHGAPRQIADLRADLRGSNNTGTPFGENLSTILNFRAEDERARLMMGLKGHVMGVLCYQQGPEVVQTANAAADVIGAMYLRGDGDPEVSGQGKPGAFSIVVGGPVAISAQYHGNAFGVRLVVDQDNISGERVDNWACKVVTDA